MKKIHFFCLAMVATLFTACFAEFASLTGGAVGSANKSAAPLSQAEINAGLKEALSQGVNKGIEYLGKKGYYADVATRIGLPPEALVITQNISKLPGGQALVDNVVKGINAAATDAVKDAAPIFLKAIKDMTFADAAKILAGGKTAATDYFRQKTKTDLKVVFGKKIDVSLQKKLIGNVSAASSWNTLTSQWNGVAGSVVGQVAGLKTVNTNLNDYLTEQAVEVLYTKIGEEEAKIRTTAAARTTALLRKVFGR